MMRPFPHHRPAAMALLKTAPLKPREGQFCGGLAFSDDPLTEKQANWLRLLLDRHGLPPLMFDGGAAQ